jgi:hypothetical protein
MASNMVRALPCLIVATLMSCMPTREVTESTVVVVTAESAGSQAPFPAAQRPSLVPTTVSTTGPSTLAQGQVALYEDVGFTGREWIVSGDVPSFSAVSGDLNDRVSSVRVGPGAAVLLYEHDAFGGRHVWIEQDAPSLVSSTLGNDVASSARVRASLVPGEVALYEHVGFEGREWIVRGDTLDLSSWPGAAGAVSALRIAPHTRVMLFTSPGFAGMRQSFDGAARGTSVPTLVGEPIGNDRAASLKVRTN